MNTIQVSIPKPTIVALADAPLSLPIAIPSLVDITQFAKALHATDHAWEGTTFGWPADYTPEINEQEAVFEEYDADGVVTTVVAPRWSPAMFCIGINDLWYVALSWEFGVDQEPWIHVEDDYGYQFDDSQQVALMRAMTVRSI